MDKLKKKRQDQSEWDSDELKKEFQRKVNVNEMIN